MRIVFLGTADFAVPSLLATADHHDVTAVITQPEKAGSRGRAAPRPVADAARARGLNLWQPQRLREPESVARVLALEPDALVVAAYGQMVPEVLLNGAHHGGINVHASLLPRWRGASPVAAAILAGDAETGVSIMEMDAGLDTGPVYVRRPVPIADDATTPALTSTLAGIGAGALLDVLSAVERGEATAEPQSDADATYAPRLTREDGRIDWVTHSGRDVDRRVRALQPWPAATAPVAGMTVQVLTGAPVDTVDGQPGSLAGTAGESIIVAAREGGYRIDSLKPPGSRAMSPAAFLRGRRIPADTDR